MFLSRNLWALVVVGLLWATPVEAQISFIGSAESSGGGGDDVTVTLPSAAQNDLVVLVFAIGDNDNNDLNMTMVTTGYTEVADAFTAGVSTTDLNTGAYWKVMGASPDTEAVVNGQGGVDASVAAMVMVFRGVDTTTPMDVTPTNASGSTFNPNPPSINHNNPSGVWTVIGGSSSHTLGGAGTYTFPTGYTTNAADVGGDDTTDVTVGMGYNTGPADPEDPGEMTHSGTDDASFRRTGITIALRPAAAPGTAVKDPIGIGIIPFAR